MWIRFTSAALLLLITSGCSSVSLPSMPWSGPAVQPNPTAEALFDEGMRYYENKKYVLAIDRFQRVKAEFPFSPQLIAAELKVADAYFLNKQYPEAVAAFREFQALHPTNENIPFVIYRLGESHFEQFTTTDRDQKMTEIAKGYFETVITSHPKSPYAEKAKEKLAKCLEYLAEHEFNIASFYLREKKYPAARDRFEEILRKYRNTPTAVKALFYLGETHREEKNGVKAALAYEALIQHYPESRLAGEAKTRLAQIEKEKHDPLAMLLIRERRPSYAAPAGGLAPGESVPQQTFDELNLVAKKEVVHEEPGSDRGFFSRMVDTLNPFSSSDKKEEPVKKTQTVKTKQAPPKEEESQGFFSSLWGSLNPFSSSSEEKKEAAKDPQLVGQIDQSLKQKGVDTAAQVASKPPASDLPKVEEPAAPPVDTKKLLREIDTSLQKQGASVAELPPTPEIAPVLNTPASEVQKPVPATAKVDSSPSATGLLSNIDEKLKSQGIEPPKVELPPPPSQAPARKEQPKKVELEPKLPVEKGPLFLERAELETQEKPTASAQEPRNEAQEQPPEKAQESPKTLPQSVVKGPPQPQPTKQIEPKPAETKTSEQGEEGTKGVFDQLREDAGRIGRILNPFSW